MGPGRRARAVSSPKTEEFLSRPTGKISIQNRVLGTSPRFNLWRGTTPVGAKALEVGEKSIGKLSIDPDGPAGGHRVEKTEELSARRLLLRLLSGLKGGSAGY